MSKGDACFYCRNSTNGRPDTIGWIYDCKLGIDNRDLNGGSNVAATCPGFDPRIGFQMGGYYTHMWFETDPPTTQDEIDKHGIELTQDRCLTWIIQGDGEFPIGESNVMQRARLEFHICDFTQIERFVEFWGKELRKRGWIADKEQQEGTGE